MSASRVHIHRWLVSAYDGTEDKGLPAADGRVDDLEFEVMSADPTSNPQAFIERILANVMKTAVTMRPKRPENWKIIRQRLSQAMRGGEPSLNIYPVDKQRLSAGVAEVSVDRRREITVDVDSLKGRGIRLQWLLYEETCSGVFMRTVNWLLRGDE